MTAYKFTVPNGDYEVKLRFAETYPYSGISGRVFHVRIEGVEVETGLDVVARVGRYRALDLTYQTHVYDGLLNIDFVIVAGPPSVGAIQVLASDIPPVPTPTPPSATRTRRRPMSSKPSPAT